MDHERSQPGFPVGRTASRTASTKQLAASGLLPANLDAALDALAALIEPVEAHLSWRPQLGDPDDEMVLEAAINGRADASVTYNATHFRAAASCFGVRLARPVDILREALEP
jgi:hypothetical protein